jgi:hypothetical protein
MSTRRISDELTGTRTQITGFARVLIMICLLLYCFSGPSG